MSDYDHGVLEGWVNEFIKNNEVIDIQFQFSGATTKKFAVMITYEDYEK
jgi:hypothetical protein